MDLVSDSFPVWGSGPETSSLNIKESWTETNMDQEIMIKLRTIYFSSFTAKEAETWREAVTCPIQAAMEPGPDSGRKSFLCLHHVPVLWLPGPGWRPCSCGGCQMASQSPGWRAPEDPVVSPRLAAHLPHWHCGHRAEGLSEGNTCSGKDKNVGDSHT